MKTGVVLGGGGLVGMAYHAGVLHALNEVGGFDAAQADLVVGTSAGSVVGAYLRTGRTTEDFWRLAMGTHPEMAAIGEVDGGSGPVMHRAYKSPLGMLRRSVGAAWVVGTSVSRIATPRLPGFLRHAFPGHLFALGDGARRLDIELGDEWPERDLWLCAYDIKQGRRIVLGAEGAPSISPGDAVRASCAIPGVYSPVQAAGMLLIDGGVWSPTNLDLAAKADCDVVVCVAPMAFDPSRAPARAMQMVRRMPTRMVVREAAAVRKTGAEVLMIRPSPEELRAHGMNLMRPDGLDRVARAAYDDTARALSTDRFRSTLDLIRSSRPAA